MEIYCKERKGIDLPQRKYRAISIYEIFCRKGYEGENLPQIVGTDKFTSKYAKGKFYGKERNGNIL
jgi:hypothetical protein